MDIDNLPIIEGTEERREVGDSVYYLGDVLMEERTLKKFELAFADEFNGTDWRDTRVTVGMVLGGGTAGRDHWGWPGEPFAYIEFGGVDNEGKFFLYLDDAGNSRVVSGVFRWIRQQRHGTTGRTWKYR